MAAFKLFHRTKKYGTVGLGFLSQIITRKHEHEGQLYWAWDASFFLFLEYCFSFILC